MTTQPQPHQQMQQPQQTPMEPVQTDYAKVGWQFVQEYFSLKNRTPERLHLFYNKNSIFSYGTEGEQPITCVGQQEIFHRIREFDFQDCKVLISNVDSIPSVGRSILIQVLGEISNKGGPSHKFVEAFVLAEQPSGYYVLNDVFRFLKEDMDSNPFDSNGVEQVVQQQQASAASYVNGDHSYHPAPTRPVKQQQQPQAPQPAQASPAKQPQAQVDQRSRSPSPAKPQQAPVVPPAQQQQQPRQPSPAPPASPKRGEEKGAASAAPAAGVLETGKKSAWGSAPAPAPAPSKPQQAQQQPAPAPESPPKPKTWANLAATNSSGWGGAVSGTPAAVENVDHPAPVQQAKGPRPASAVGKGPGDRTREEGARPPRMNPREDRDKYTIYVKGVQEGMEPKDLEELFVKAGAIKQVDIVLPKNIAFVEFHAVESVAKALGSYSIQGKTIYAEERNRNRTHRAGGAPGTGAPAGRGGKSYRGKPRYTGEGPRGPAPRGHPAPAPEK